MKKDRRAQIVPNAKSAKKAYPRSDRRIWAIAGPAILANSSAPLVGLVDTWVIAQSASPAGLAAIGAGATVFSFLLWTFGFLRMGTTGLVAQAKGRGDPKAIADLIIQGLALGAFLGFILILFSVPLKAGAVALLDLPTEVREDFTPYFMIRILGAPFALMLYSINGALIGMEQARSSLILQVTLNILNGVLNIAFVAGLEWGATGIAAGTLIAESLTVILGGFLLLRHHSVSLLISSFKDATKWRATALKQLFQVNAYIFARSLFLLAVFFMVTRISAQMGTASLAASHILNTYLLLISLGLDGFAYAAEALTGDAFGQRNRRAFRFWSYKTSLWGLWIALLYSVAFWIFGDIITNIIIPPEAVMVRDSIAKATPLLIILPLVGLPSYMLDGIFIGATAVRAMLLTMALSATACFLFMPYLAERYGLPGLWAAVALFLAFRGMSQICWYPYLEKKITP